MFNFDIYWLASNQREALGLYLLVSTERIKELVLVLKTRYYSVQSFTIDGNTYHFFLLNCYLSVVLYMDL